MRFCSRLSSMLTVRPRLSDPSSGSKNKGLSILSRFGWRLPDDSMGIFAYSPPGEVTPHSARKVHKMPANGISSELRAHQMARMFEVPGRPRTRKSTPISYEILDSCRISRFRLEGPRSRHALEPTCRFCRAGCSESAFGLLFLRFVLLVSISSILVLVLCRSFEGRSRLWCWSDIR